MQTRQQLQRKLVCRPHLRPGGRPRAGVLRRDAAGHAGAAAAARPSHAPARVGQAPRHSCQAPRDCCMAPHRARLDAQHPAQAAKHAARRLGAGLGGPWQGGLRCCGGCGRCLRLGCRERATDATVPRLTQPAGHDRLMAWLAVGRAPRGEARSPSGACSFPRAVSGGGGRRGGVVRACADAADGRKSAGSSHPPERFSLAALVTPP